MAVFLWEIDLPTTTYKGWTLPAQGGSIGTWGTELNDNPFADADTNLGGLVTKSLASTNVTLSATEAKNAVVRLIGTISAAIQVTNPNIGFWYCENRTSGAFTVTVTNGVGTPLEIPQGYCVAVISDSTNGCRYGNDNPGEVFIASGASAAEGLVPDPGSTAGTGRYLREDATFVVPPFQWTPGGRLTLTSGTPVTTGDVTAATSVYYTAMNGSTIPIYGSCLSAPTQFAPVTITGGELTLTLNNPNHAANTNYDVFAFLDGTTVRIGSGPPWTSSTTRGTGAGTTQISLASGLWTNTVSMTARNGASTYSVAAGAATYLGTIRTGSSAGTTEDSKSNRFVFNGYNQVARSVSVTDATNTWTYNTASWRQANGSTANQVAAVFGLVTSAVDIMVMTTAVGDDGIVAVGVGVSSTTVNSCQVYGGRTNTTATITGRYTGVPGLGYYYFAWLETGAGVSTTWYGDGGTNRMATGLCGFVWA